MRRKITIGITLIAIVALSTLATFAYTDSVVSARPIVGPRLAQHLVARQDSGTAGPKPTAPSPGKPIPIDQAVAKPGNTMSGINSHTGSVSMGVASPQVALESRLKSLAMDLR